MSSPAALPPDPKHWDPGGEGSATINMDCIFGFYSATAAGLRLVSVFDMPNTENTKQRSKLHSGTGSYHYFPLLPLAFLTLAVFSKCSTFPKTNKKVNMMPPASVGFSCGVEDDCWNGKEV
ncbi:hypothetical protein BTVI_150522 [Pitangus sulphuratus]|nr:hypothetical protein BTVI_150522 [Pitangus sulphuratus]